MCFNTWKLTDRVFYDSLHIAIYLKLFIFAASNFGDLQI